MIKDLYIQILKYNFKPNHKFDQNFIIDDNVILRVIKELELEPNDVVLEIGAGTGFLTKKLLENCKQVIAIEKDKKMIEILGKEFENEILEKKLIIVNSDILKTDLKKYKYTKIASFLPYSISQDFFEKIIEEKKKMVIVVQKEFAEKLVSFPGFINYNAITVLCQTYFKITNVKKVSKSCFFPVPSCESSIVKFEPKDKNYDKNYNTFIKSLFRYPNKDIKSALGFMGIKDTEKIPPQILKKKVRQTEIEEINSFLLK